MLISLALATTTRVRFGGDGVWPEPDQWALLEVEKKASMDTIAADREVQLWLAKPAAQQVWQYTKQLIDFSDEPQHNAVQHILSKHVPGLDGVSFAEVFDAFNEAGCPVWLIGGTVRDLIAGRKPNDVDTAVLCDSRVVKRACTQKGWQHDPPDHETAEYFSVGIAHGENEEYLEGFSIDLVMKDPFTPETSVNMLMWSVSHSFVVDPSGYGVQDARDEVLRPGAPPVNLVEQRDVWSAWRQWVLMAFSGPSSARHNRYLKMRMRGWQPVEDTEEQPAGLCFRFFMANQMAQLMPLEVKDPMGVINPRDGMTLTEPKQPMVPGATLHFLQEKLPKMKSEEEKAAYVHKFFTAMVEDLDVYYAAPRAEYQACLGQRHQVVAKESHTAVRSSHDLIRTTLVKVCEQPPMHILALAHPKVFAPPEVLMMMGDKIPETDFAGACAHLLAEFNAATGRAHVASDFALPAGMGGMMGGMPAPGMMGGMPAPGMFDPRMGGMPAPGMFDPRMGGMPAPGMMDPRMGGMPAPGMMDPRMGGAFHVPQPMPGQPTPGMPFLPPSAWMERPMPALVNPPQVVHVADFHGLPAPATVFQPASSLRIGRHGFGHAGLGGIPSVSVNVPAGGMAPGFAPPPMVRHSTIGSTFGGGFAPPPGGFAPAPGGAFVRHHF